VHGIIGHVRDKLLSDQGHEALSLKEILKNLDYQRVLQPDVIAFDARLDHIILDESIRNQEKVSNSVKGILENQQ
jgi:hypothetical protein